MPSGVYKRTEQHNKAISEARKLPYGEASFNELYGKYRIWAKERGIEFRLTKGQVKKIVQGDCYYCGAPPSRVVRKDSSHHNGQFISNGIDRINNDGVYTRDNCVACCKMCNYAKNSNSYEDFRAWVRQVYNYMELNHGIK